MEKIIGWAMEQDTKLYDNIWTEKVFIPPISDRLTAEESERLFGKDEYEPEGPEFNTESQGRRIQHRPMNENLCVRCGIRGHWHTSCRYQSDIRCLMCARLGHSIRACRLCGFENRSGENREADMQIVNQRLRQLGLPEGTVENRNVYVPHDRRYATYS